MRKPIDISGQRFGRFTVKRYVGASLWECVCDCGEIRQVKGADLRLGHRKGCLKCREPNQVRAPDANERKRLNRIWHAMRSRCENPESDAYHNYGGRGIYVCDRWQSFEAFYADVTPAPAGLTLDRKDNDGPYSPENCRWADRKEQARNSRVAVWIEHGGIRDTIEGWAERIDIPSRRLWHRINRGRTPQEAIALGRGRCRRGYVPRSNRTTTQAVSR